MRGWEHVQVLSNRLYSDTQQRWKLSIWLMVVVVLLGWVLSVYCGSEPDLLASGNTGHKSPPGVLLVDTVARTVEKLYDKPGGYLSNDVLPPWVFMDDLPAWESGVLLQVRLIVHSLNHDFAMSHSQYQDDPDLSAAESAFAVDAHSWLFPSAESEFRAGVLNLRHYELRLQQTPPAASFYVRPDALVVYLQQVNGELGRMSAHLNAAVAPETTLVQDTEPVLKTTSWWKIDDEFYNVRGQCWTLVAILRAIGVEYADYLQSRHADLALRAAIHELVASQQTVWSPMILNGRGFGVFANHSLTLANYVDRAHLDLEDVRSLLQH